MRRLSMITGSSLRRLRADEVYNIRVTLPRHNYRKSDDLLHRLWLVTQLVDVIMPKIKIEKDFTIVITWRDSSGNYVGKQRVKVEVN